MMRSPCVSVVFTPRLQCEHVPFGAFDAFELSLYPLCDAIAVCLQCYSAAFAMRPFSVNVVFAPHLRFERIPFALYYISDAFALSLRCICVYVCAAFRTCLWCDCGTFVLCLKCVYTALALCFLCNCATFLIFSLRVRVVIVLPLRRIFAAFALRLLYENAAIAMRLRRVYSAIKLRLQYDRSASTKRSCK
jgi:hypothetical protein